MQQADKISKPGSTIHFILPKAPLGFPTSAIDCSPCHHIPLLGALYRQRFHTLCNLIGSRRYGAILDIGFGGGILFPTLSHIAERIIGVDLHDKHANVRNNLMQCHGIHPLLVRGSAIHLPFKDRSLPAIISLSNLYYLGDQLDHALHEINRIAHPDADIYIGTSSRAFYQLVLRRTAYRNFQTIRKNVFQSIREHFTVEESRTIPSRVPLNMSLFFVADARLEKGVREPQ